MEDISIRLITENKKDFLPLLLLGDEQESQIDKYLERGDLFSLYDKGLKSVCVVTDEGGGILEIQNLATDSRYQKQGYASRLIDYVAGYYAGRYDKIILGTGDVPGILAFYQRRGFAVTHRVADYFTTHYDHPIIDDGVLLKDKVYLERKLRQKETKNMVLETKRLILREMTQSDFPLLCKHLQDAEVMYAYEHAFSDTEVQEGINKQLQSYEQHGFGVWSVILKENGELIGHCGLSMQPCEDREVLEIGYIFQKAYWHKGYAIEAAIACREYAFNELDVDEVFSLIRDTNIASQNVAKRNGMSIRGTYTKHYHGIDMPHYIFSVKRQRKDGAHG